MRILSFLKHRFIFHAGERCAKRSGNSSGFLAHPDASELIVPCRNELYLNKGKWFPGEYADQEMVLLQRSIRWHKRDAFDGYYVNQEGV